MSSNHQPLNAVPSDTQLDRIGLNELRRTIGELQNVGLSRLAIVCN